MTVPVDRPLRVDAQRNHVLILEAAEAVLGSQGLEAPIDEIARRAGVGVGTVYRHFPTKEALLTAIVAAHLEPLIEAAHAAREAEDPGSAFFTFLQRLAEEFVAFKALADTMVAAGFDIKAAKKDVTGELITAVGDLLVRAQRAGCVRPDLTIDDVSMLMAGLGQADCASVDSGLRSRYVSLMCDAMAIDTPASPLRLPGALTERH